MKVLEIEKLGKRFPNRKGADVLALDSVTLSIERGQKFGLVGGSGSGKTTLALCILRLLRPTTGEIRFMGQDWLALKGRDLKTNRRKVQPVFQDPDSSLNPLFRLRQVIEEPLIAHRIGNKQQRRERAERLGMNVGLDQADLDRLPKQLSGGQRQRVAIARALAPEPELLIADEPVSSLDLTTQSQIMLLLEELNQELGLAILFISHDLALVASFCDRVAVIYQGQLVEMAGKKELFTNPLHPYTQALVEAATFKAPAGIEKSFTGGKKGLKEIRPGHWARL